jgi:hypothetical protein
MPDDYDDDDGIGMEPEEEDPNRLEDLIGAEMAMEVQEICSRAHTLLGAEVVGGYGAAEMQRVCLDIPKGLLLVAQYVVGREHYNQPWQWMRDALEDKGREGQAVRAVVHDRLAKYLKDALHEELHWLATGGHRIISAEVTRRDKQAENPDQA